MATHPAEWPLIGVSNAMTSVFAYADKVARSDATVLLTGESGTGKENLAHYIHAHSSRHTHPFISINCATLPESLFEGLLKANESFGRFDAEEDAEAGESRGAPLRTDRGA